MSSPSGAIKEKLDIKQSVMFTGVVQAVDTLPAGEGRGLALPLQRSVVLKATARSGSLLLWTLLWGVVTGEGER